MSPRVFRILIVLCGFFGTIFLSIYFGVGAGLGLGTLPPNATQAQVVSLAVQYEKVWYLGTWLQATGSLLCVIFFLALVYLAKAVTKLSGILTLLGSATLLAVVLIEGAFTIDLAQAAVNGHLATSLTSFDLMTVFTHIYALAPAPVIFLALGAVLLESRLLPRAFGYLALVLGAAFEVVGLISLLILPWLVLVVLSVQTLWILAAAIALLVRKDQVADTAVQELVPVSEV